MKSNQPAARLLHQICLQQELIEQFLSSCLVACYESLAFTLLPAVAVGCRRGDLELTVVTFVTDASALRTATE